jgi:hypothetical protein
VQWVLYFLAGPNKLMRICSAKNSYDLLDSLYQPGRTISDIDDCLIAWQLAIGALFTANTSEQTYTSIYLSARAQTMACVEQEEGSILWIVPAILLECVYLMNSKPQNCWVLLG